MIVAGWADGYRNNTLRTFAALECEKRLLIGPWSHMATATSLPGPHIDLVPEMIDFFDRHLRDGERARRRRSRRSRSSSGTRRARNRTSPSTTGVWRYEDSVAGRARDDARAATERRRAATLVPVRGDVGGAAWISCAASLPWGQPSDQRGDDAWSRLLRVAGRRRVRDPRSLRAASRG